MTGRARGWAVMATALMLVAVTAVPASAYWSSEGTGFLDTTTATLAAPGNVTVPASVDYDAAGTDVAVSWSAETDGIEPAGYHVNRTDGSTSTAACGSSPVALIDTLACTDTDVPAGVYRYTVTAVFRSWTAVSAESSTVTVQAEPSLLGAAASYSVLAATSVTSTGATRVSGDLGLSPGIVITGFPPGTVGGTTHVADTAAASAQVDLVAAYGDLAARTATTQLAGDLVGTTLTPGVYHSAAALSLTGVLTLDAVNDPDAVFVIQVDAALSTAASSEVKLINGATASNVYWVVLGAVGTGASAAFSGTILAQGAITLGADSVLIGRALSRGTVTLAGNTVRFTDALPPTMTVDGGPVMTTKDATPTITGTSDAPLDSPVTVTVNNQILTTSMSTGGVWSVTASALTAGVHPIVAKVRDSFGNGATASQQLTVEINPAMVVLGSAASYSILAVTSVVNTGSTTVSGDLGVSSGTSSGFPSGTVGGTVHEGDAEAIAAQGDLIAALDEVAGRTPHTEFAGDLNGRTFRQGIHHSSAAVSLNGTVTLDAEGDPDAIFIFHADAAMNTAASSTVQLINEAKASNVFWVVTGATGLGANSTFVGVVLARGAITVGDGTTMVGQVLSRDTVTLANNALTGVIGAP